MRLAIIGDARVRTFFDKQFGEQQHTLFFADTLGELMDEHDAIFYTNSEEELVEDLETIKGLSCPVFVHAVVITQQELNANVIRMNTWPGFLQRSVLEVCALDPLRATATAILDQLEWKHHWVPDVPGLLAARIVAAIINEAYYALEDNVSTREEIDIAMKLGTNYPYGPFEWSVQIGKKNIFVLLSKLSKDNKRYIPALHLSYESTS